MVRCSIVGRALAALTLAVLVLPAARGGQPGKPLMPRDPSANGSVSKIYPLAGINSDSNLGAWIADTLPKMVRPETWTAAGGPGALSYYAPGQVLVVRQTPAVQAEVTAFLDQLKRSLSLDSGQTRTPASLDGPVRPASYVPNLQTPPSTAAPAQPARATARSATGPAHPKHLFHIILEGLEMSAEEGPQNMKLKNFTIRYEGEGLIDTNVAGMIKALAKQGGIGMTTQKWYPDNTMTLPAAKYLQHTPDYIPAAVPAPPPQPARDPSVSPEEPRETLPMPRPLPRP